MTIENFPDFATKSRANNKANLIMEAFQMPKDGAQIVVKQKEDPIHPAAISDTVIQEVKKESFRSRFIKRLPFIH